MVALSSARLDGSHRGHQSRNPAGLEGDVEGPVGAAHHVADPTNALEEHLLVHDLTVLDLETHELFRRQRRL